MRVAELRGLRRLDVVEQALPEHAKPGTPDHRVFVAARHRVLDTCNRARRELPKILGCYALRQVVRRELIARVVIPGHGPFNLPPSVLMPGEKPAAKAGN